MISPKYNENYEMMLGIKQEKLLELLDEITLKKEKNDEKLKTTAKM